MTTRMNIALVTIVAAVAACTVLAEEVTSRQSGEAVYLSDLSRTGFPSPHPKRLVDAKRRTFSFAMPTYQCDRSAVHGYGSTQARPISIQGKSYEKGLGSGVPFVLTYDLRGEYASFSAIVGVDDAEEKPEEWLFEVYLDGVKAATRPVPKDKAVDIDVDTTGVQEVVLVGIGRDKMAVVLADARLQPAPQPIKPAKDNPTNRKEMLELDDRIVMDSEVLLQGKTAKKIDAQAGPDESAAGTGGYGRTTSSRGPDMWAGIKDKGDLLRWQAFVRRPGSYRVWVRVVSSAPGKNPTSEDYVVRVDGEDLKCELADQKIVERMGDERFTGYLWGYLFVDTPLEVGLHDVEVENASGAWLAVNRVVLVREGPVGESLAAGQPLKPIAAAHEISISPRWQPKKLLGWHFFSGDSGAPFARARELGMKFAPGLLHGGRKYVNADEESMRKMMSDGLPFSIHARFNVAYKSPVISEEAYQRIKRVTGDLWQGFWSTEWTDCFNFSPEAKTVPKTRKEAYERARAWFKQKAAMCYDDMLPMATTWPWDHYAGEWTGVTGFQDEPGISPQTQLRILFARGAARQYGKYWHTYIAPGAHDAHSWTVNLYMVRNRPHDTLRNPEGGSSIAWVKRMIYLTYMWGTTSLRNESPAYQTDMTADGAVALSPMGKVAAEFFEFAATHKNRGACYTPVGIMLDLMHGWGGHPIYPDHYPPMTWMRLQPEPSDYMKDALFQIIYPGQYDEINEWNILSPTPYGDLFDVMLSSASLEHIEAYPVLMLVGDVAADMSEQLVSRLEAYVRHGGTLVINAAQVANPFPRDILGVRLTDKTRRADRAKCELDGHLMQGRPFSFREVELAGAQRIISTADNAPLVTRHQVGKGAVILTTVPFLLQENLNGVSFLPHLLGHLTSGLLPFRVTGDIEYAVNRNEDSWLLTLMNNRGVYKLATEQAIIDRRQTQTVHIIMTKKPTGMRDWITGKSLAAKEEGGAWQLAIALPPGEVTIVQIRD